MVAASDADSSCNVSMVPWRRTPQLTAMATTASEAAIAETRSTGNRRVGVGRMRCADCSMRSRSAGSVRRSGASRPIRSAISR